MNLPDVSEFRHRLTWLSPGTATRSGTGQNLIPWTNNGTFWAKVEPLAGMELMNARQVKATISHKITMRNVGAIAASNRFYFEATGRIFNIDVVFRIDEQNAFYAIYATELFGEKP